MFSKRYTGTKNIVMTRIGKGKDISRTVNGRYVKHTPTLESFDGDFSSIAFSYIKSAENSDALPCIASVLSRTADEGVGMKDLDQLQQELEKLLSSCAIRTRILSSEFQYVDRVEERHEKKGKLFEPPSPKYRKIEEKCKVIKDTKPAYKPVKSFHDDIPKMEAPKMSAPKNDLKSKFWMSVDPYCQSLSQDDAVFLDAILEDCSKEVRLKIPTLGEHYSIEWTKNIGTAHHPIGRTMKTKVHVCPEGSNNGVQNGTVDDYNTSLILPLASAMLEQAVPKSQEKLMKEIKPVSKTGMCIDRRLRKELEDLGLLDLDDDSKCTPEEDEIMKEIKRCYDELGEINFTNIREINRLRTLIMKDRACQDLTHKLEEIDIQIMEVYNKLLTCDPKDKLGLEWEAVRIIQMQRRLHNETMDLSNVMI